MDAASIRTVGQVLAVIIPIAKIIIEYKPKKDYSGVNIKIEDLGKFYETVNGIFESTKADRFILFTGTNGWGSLKYVTALIEVHKNKFYITNRFVRLVVDEDYKRIIKEAEKFGKVNLVTSSLPESDLKNIYLKENIHHSKVFFLLRKKNYYFIHHIFYCSVATHDLTLFSEYEKLLIKGKIEILKTIIK